MAASAGIVVDNGVVDAAAIGTAAVAGGDMVGCAACGAVVAGSVVGDAASATDCAAFVGAGGAGTGFAFGAAAVDDKAVGLAAPFVPGGAGPSGERGEYPRLPSSNRPIDRVANRPITHPVFMLTAPSLLPPGIVATNTPKPE